MKSLLDPLLLSNHNMQVEAEHTEGDTPERQPPQSHVTFLNFRLHSTSLVIKQLMGSSSRQTLQHTGCWGVSCSEHECISTTGSSKSCTKLAVHTIPEWRGQCKYKQCTCYGLSTAAVQWETNDTCYRLLYTPTNYPILNCSFTPNQSCTPLRTGMCKVASAVQIMYTHSVISSLHVLA